MAGTELKLQESWYKEMAGTELKLLGQWASVWVCRLRIALHLKGLAYEYVEEDFSNKSDLLLTSNPIHKKVPVLIHGGRPICESQLTVQYLDETFFGTGPSLLSADPHQRAIERFWTAFIDEKLVLPWAQAFKAKTEEEKAERRKLMLAAMDMLEGALRQRSKGKPFFGGDSIGYLDVMLGGLLSWLHGTEELCGAKLFDTTRTPLLLAWAERFGALDVAQGLLPDVGKVIEYAKIRRTQLAAAEAAAAAKKKAS